MKKGEGVAPPLCWLGHSAYPADFASFGPDLETKRCWFLGVASSQLGNCRRAASEHAERAADSLNAYDQFWIVTPSRVCEKMVVFDWEILLESQMAD